jgi:hypothetical protein
VPVKKQGGSDSGRNLVLHCLKSPSILIEEKLDSNKKLQVIVKMGAMMLCDFK